MQKTDFMNVVSRFEYIVNNLQKYNVAQYENNTNEKYFKKIMRMA